VLIENEFSVSADIDTVWRELLDMEGVASCLPGATITATDHPNVYDGSMRLKIGPMRVEYRGTATLSEIDEENHTAVISLSAREAKGQGSAMATIRNRLEPTASGTRVAASTDLHITGPQAQFGRGVIEDVGKRVLAEFSQRLEQRIAGSASGPGVGVEEGAAGGSGGASEAAEPDRPSASAPAASAPPLASPAPPAPAPPPSSAPAPVASELDIGSLLVRTRAVRIGGALALLVIALVLLRRRR
jgi:carbon monoxide dehydrogenase subunit G